jgi:MYXO-CTERM domain-containing protein
VLYAISRQFGLAGAPDTLTLLASTDAGGSFGPVWTVGDGSQLSLGAADPADAARLLLRRRTVRVCDVTDTLVLDEAGGSAPADLVTFENDPITGVSFRPSGEIWVATLRGGVSRSPDGGQSWSFAGGPDRARCLVGRPGEVVACLPSPDPVLGLIARTTDEGQSWAPLVDWSNVVGPPACLAQTCAAHWQKMQATWIAPPHLDGGVDRQHVDLGGTGDVVESEPGGCTCATGPRPARAWPWAFVLLVLAWRRQWTGRPGTK